MLLTLLNNVNKLLNSSTTNGYKKPWSISAVPPNLRWLVSLLTSHGLQKNNLMKPSQLIIILLTPRTLILKTFLSLKTRPPLFLLNPAWRRTTPLLRVPNEWCPIENITFQCYWSFQTIYLSIDKYCSKLIFTFITETWLLPPNKYSPPPWKQFHTYSVPVNSYNLHRGQLGLALLVSPEFKLPIHHTNHVNPLLTKFTLSIIINSKLLIHCLYLPPSLESAQVSEILSLLPLDYPTTNKTIICGDFNSRIGELVGDSRWNTSRRIFRNWMEAHNLVLWNQHLAFGQPTSYTYHGTSIIDYFLSNTELDNPDLVIEGRYGSAFKNGITSLVAQSDDDTEKTMLTDKNAAIFKRKQFYFEKWRKANGLNCLTYWPKHQEKSTLLQRLIQQRHRETWKQFCSKMATGEYTKAIARFSRIRKNRTIKPSFSPEPGINRAPADVMTDHLKGIFAGHLLTPTPDLDSSPTSTSSPPFALYLSPGVDHIQTEMLLPLLPTLVPQLLHLFRVCWQWSYTPLSWRVAQGGFRESRSFLDQAQCLIEICPILRRNHNSFPTLAFLDIKSAYDTVDRSYVWRELQSHLCPALLGILKNLFYDVQIEILLDNRVSYRFSPVTGVLQGSILSLFLHSIYINRLPSILRQPLLLGNSFSGDIVSDLTPTINCLLYADDVVLIANPENLTASLHQCEAHSYSVGYRWSPLKCVIVAPNSDAKTYQLYGTTILKESSFPYLGIHIKSGGLLDYPAMIQHNISKTSLTMNQLAAIGLSSKGFPPLLASRFYSQMIRAQLDYGLAISPLTTKFIHQLDTFQTNVLDVSSAVILDLHLKSCFIWSISHRCELMLQSFKPSISFVVLIYLMILFLPICCHIFKLQLAALTDKKIFLSLRTKFLADQFQNLYNNSDSILLSYTRPNIQVDPILWLPMNCSERSRVLRWRLG
ncbi:hypothetical protein G6F56_005307 [Rhizopus delemar]|nr:hypothetical protein G6F56_005307 [Rhizopus delemar]